MLLVAKRTLGGHVALTAKKDQKPQRLQVAATGKQVQLDQICVHRQAKSYQEADSDEPQLALRSTAGQEQHESEQRQIHNNFNAVGNVCIMSGPADARSNAEYCLAQCDTDDP